jgi:hypothetical protein
MAAIDQTIETSKSVVEMREIIDTKILGTVTVEHHRVHIHIELSLFGAAARGQLESMLTEQVKRLGK